ncbi:MAG: hypothetical protein KGQ28_09475 [Hyphomicrobiales bacterium]|nr:hypothetical protein [Hyphomicrobiales bacterium]
MRVKSAFVAVALAAAAYAHWRTGAPDEAAARAMADAAAADAPAIADVVAPRRARVLPVVAAAGAQAGERTGALGDGTGAPYAGIYASPLFGALVAARTREPTVDESGLRYYAALHDRVRVAAEAKRLEELYPDWSPPTDLSARGGAGRDEQPLWDLFAAGKLDALRAAIRLRESTVAGWKPSSELAKKLGRREAQVAIAAATAKRDPRAALTAAAATPGALACDSVDTAWKVADAFVALDMPERAFELDQGVVATCKDFHERLATVERAVASLPEADARRLIALGAARADGTNEFAPAAIALTRALLVKESQGQKADVTAEEVAA